MMIMEQLTHGLLTQNMQVDVVRQLAVEGISKITELMMIGKITELMMMQQLTRGLLANSTQADVARWLAGAGAGNQQQHRADDDVATYPWPACP